MQLKKLLGIGLFVLTITSLLFGCQTKKTKNGDYITVTDMLGETLEVKKNPRKVACVSRTTYDLLVTFGLGDRIDGAFAPIYDNPWTEVIYRKAKNEYRYAYNESPETFITRGVDLVFAPEKYVTDNLKKHGVKALNISLYGNPTFDKYVYFFADLVKQIWDTDEVKTKVDEWKAKVTKAFSDVTEELSKHEITQKKIMYVRGDRNKGIGYTDIKSSFTEYAFRTLGFDFGGTYFGTNKPSQETIMKYNPDIFVIGGIYQNKLVELLKNDKTYNTLEAVKTSKIYTIPVGLTMFEQLSAMTPIFIYDMANKIYKEYFNYDIKEMVKETLKVYFGQELTDEQVSYMLLGKDANGKDLA